MQGLLLRLGREGQQEAGKRLGHDAQDTVSEASAQAKLEEVDADIVQHAIRPGQIYVFEYAGAGLPRRALEALQLACGRDDQHLPRLYIPYPLEADRPECAIF